MPRYAVGSRLLAVAPSSEHKTNLVLAKGLDAISEHGARVLFAAGEAADDLLTERIPAQCTVRGIAVESLDENLIVTEACPLLTNLAEVEASIEEHRAFNPDIVVIDTLSEAMTGQDENAANVASLVMEAAGIIRKAFNATVILVHHMGKDEKRGARGSSVFRAGADAEWQISFDRAAGTVKQHVAKMRRGRAGFDVIWGTRIVGGEPGEDGTMTVCRLNSEELARIKENKTQDRANQHNYADIVEALTSLNAFGRDAEVTVACLAERLARATVADGRFADERAGAEAIQKKRDWLKNQLTRNPLVGGLVRPGYPHGVNKGPLQNLWSLPKAAGAEEDEL